MKLKLESDYYDVIGKSQFENKYMLVNKVYVYDELKMNGDILL